jgi:hypothetical protein
MKHVNTRLAGIFILGLIFNLISSNLSAQNQDSSRTFRVVIQFGSKCCGVPSDSLVRNFIAGFKKKNKITKLSAVHIGPMGKEGEYWLAFSLNELTKKQAACFSSKIKTIAEKLTDRGYAIFEENKKIEAGEISSRAVIEDIVF